MKKLLLLFYIAIYSVSIWSQGLIAYYPFNGNVNDLSGNNNNGTIIGGVTPAEDRFGNPNSAMQFNGVDGYIEVPNSASLQSPSNAITITGWLYIEAFSAIEAVGIVEKTNSDTYGQYGLSYQSWGDDGLYFYHSNGTQGSYAPVTLDFLRWYFVATTYDGTTAITYLDGVAIDSQSVSGPITADDNPLTIGLESPGQTEFLQGKLDDIRVYNRALTQEEIYKLIVTDIESENNDLFINDFTLFQNYPNPFNPSTKISWQSPVSGWQKLKIYDLLGNEVTTLVNEEKPAGRYEVEFDASLLSSGVYFYQIKAGKYLETKKMILLK